MSEEGSTDDHTVNRKRTRRNAIRPNSVESVALQEFSILYTLNEKTDLNEGEKKCRVSSKDGKVSAFPPAPPRSREMDVGSTERAPPTPVAGEGVGRGGASQ